MNPRVLILGGGSAGLSVAARLKGLLPQAQLQVVEPSEAHYYQPLWTLVGGGDARKEQSVRRQSDVMPKGLEWIRSSAKAIDPKTRQVQLATGETQNYDALVIATGLRCAWERIPGLQEGLGKNGVCSNYSYEHVDYTFECIRNHREGPALFTHPSTPIKCGGAPQKILYMAVDYWNRHGVRDRIQPTFCLAPAVIFAVKRYADQLLKVVAREKIAVRYQHDLVALRPELKEAIFKNLATGEEVTLPYGMIHVTPPMVAPDFVRESGLADAAGWAAVDPKTLQHVTEPAVFALGDSSNLPTSKTGAAIRKQAPVVAKNVAAFLRGEALPARYDGYTSCPLVTAKGRLILAEFGYDGKIMETFPFDQSKERRSMYFLKKHLLPLLYWKGMLKGRA